MSEKRRAGKRKAPEESVAEAEVAVEVPDAKKPKVARKRAAPQAVVEGDCTICFENYKNDYGNLKCNHVYCFGCIEAWSKTENTCPLCKVVFTYIDRYDSAQVGANGKIKKKRVRVKRKTQRETLQEQHRQRIHDMLQTHVLPNAFGAFVGGFLPMNVFANAVQRHSHHHHHRISQYQEFGHDFDDEDDDDEFMENADDDEAEREQRNFMREVFGLDEEEDEDHFGEEDDDEEQMDPDWARLMTRLFPVNSFQRIRHRGFHGSVVDLATDGQDGLVGSRAPQRSNRGSSSIDLIDLTGDDDEPESAPSASSNARTSISSSLSTAAVRSSQVGSSSSSSSISLRIPESEVSSSHPTPSSGIATITSGNDNSCINVDADDKINDNGQLSRQTTELSNRSSDVQALDVDDEISRIDWLVEELSQPLSRSAATPSRSSAARNDRTGNSSDRGEPIGFDASRSCDGLPVQLVSATVLRHINSLHRAPSANGRQALLPRGPGIYRISTHVGPNGRFETTRTFVPRSENSS